MLTSRLSYENKHNITSSQIIECIHDDLKKSVRLTKL